jgi:hypothetical protein
MAAAFSTPLPCRTKDPPPEGAIATVDAAILVPVKPSTMHIISPVRNTIFLPFIENSLCYPFFRVRSISDGRFPAT